METLAAATRSDAEEVGIIRHLHLALFPRDVNTYRKSPTVSIIGSQRSVFRALEVFLEEEAQSGIGERQKEVVVRIEGIAVSGEAVGNNSNWL